MDAALRDLLAEIQAFGQKNDAKHEEYSKRMLNLEPETAHFISILVRASQRKRVLEIGTSNGYSTIWLAWSVQATEGHVWSIDRDPAKHEMADANLKRAGLRDRVDLLLGDATEVIKSLEGPFDLVFFDAYRPDEPEQLRRLLSLLAPGAIVLADNVHSHPDQIKDYIHQVESLPEFDHTVIPVGKGLSIAYKG